MDIRIRPAKLSDLASVLSILDEAVLWLNSIGMGQQWGRSALSANQAFVQEFEAHVSAGNVFLARRGNDDVGTFRLTDSDTNTWPDARPGEALYLHSLAIRRSAAGQGIALQMLDWAGEHAALKSRPELRLDCWAGNERLRRYYKDAGFQHRGDLTYDAPSGFCVELSRFARRSGSA